MNYEQIKIEKGIPFPRFKQRDCFKQKSFEKENATDIFRLLSSLQKEESFVADTYRDVVTICRNARNWKGQILDADFRLVYRQIIPFEGKYRIWRVS